MRIISPCADAGDAQTRLLEFGNLAHRLFGEGAVGEHGQFGEIFGVVLVFEFAAFIAPIGQQELAEHEHGQDAGRGGREADGRDLEERKGFEPLATGNAIDEQAGRGADQGQRAAEDCGIGDGDQEPGGGDVERCGEPDHDRDQHEHHRRVVHESGGDEGRQQEDPERELRIGLGAFEHEARHAFEHAGPDQGACQHEHGGDRQGGGIREDPHGLVGRHEAEDDEEGRPGGGRHFGRVFLPDEEGEQHDDQPQCDLRLVVCEEFREHIAMAP